MPDNPKVLQFTRPTLAPGPSERTITVSYSHLLLLFDAFEHCATALQHKLTLLDEVYDLLPGNHEVGLRRTIAAHRDEQQTVAQVLVDLRAMRAEAEHQAD